MESFLHAYRTLQAGGKVAKEHAAEVHPWRLAEEKNAARAVYERSILATEEPTSPDASDMSFTNSSSQIIDLAVNATNHSCLYIYRPREAGPSYTLLVPEALQTMQAIMSARINLDIYINTRYGFCET